MHARLPIPQSTRHPFDLAKVLDGSQDFRWCKLDQEWFSGVLDGNIVHVRQCDGYLEYRACTDLDSLLTSYFRLDEDVDAIYAALSLDPVMAALAQDYPWLRVLRQPDPWECMVAYICSANNNVARISRIVEDIAAKFGKPVQLGQDTRYTFPGPEVLEAGSVALAEMGLGLKRHIRIPDAARLVCSGELDFTLLSSAETPYPDVKRRLMRVRVGGPKIGVGPKIADCIALFSLDKPEAFPVDRHIREALRSRYLPSGARISDKQLDKQLEESARARFGKYAGWAGQLLFQSQWRAAP